MKLTEKKKLLETYKKWVMQKIFSREIRFKDENGEEFEEWEEKKIWDIFDKVTRWNVLAMTKVLPKQQDDYLYPVYSSQTKNHWLSGFYTQFLFENAITWTTDWANAWDVNYRKDKFYCTNVCGVLLSDEWYANQCIAEILNSVTRNYVSYVWNPKLMNNVMSNISVYIPSSVEEQQKIASFLTEIDTKIEVVWKELEVVEKWKKGLLQEMFI
jgi:type I restriction enzyme S subunit